MDKEGLRKEFNDFLDSATDEQIRDFLKFIRERKAQKKSREKNINNDPFKDRSN